MMENYSKYQQGIIKRYYEHIDQIQLQKLAELVTDLYLAEGKKKDKLWAQADVLMKKMEVPEQRIKHLMEKKDPALLATLVKEMSSS